MYGNNTAGPFTIRELGASGQIAGGQILQLVSPCNSPELGAEGAHRVGCVLTVDVPTGYLSYRIVGFIPAYHDTAPGGHPNNCQKEIVQIWNDSESPLKGPDGQWGKAGIDDDGAGGKDDAAEFGWPGSDDLIHVGDQFIINGTPFGGSGFGFNASTGRANATDSAFSQLLALQPNYLWNNAAAMNDSNDGFLRGGANEDYDAADFQNMLLAIPLPDGSVIPSLHRPELLRYWQNFGGGRSWCTYTWSNICSPGTYAPAGWGGYSYCFTCSGGKYSSWASSSCTNCPAGTYSYAGYGGCPSCGGGYYQPYTVRAVCNVAHVACRALAVCIFHELFGRRAGANLLLYMRRRLLHDRRRVVVHGLHGRLLLYQQRSWQLVHRCLPGGPVLACRLLRLL